MALVTIPRVVYTRAITTGLWRLRVDLIKALTTGVACLTQFYGILTLAKSEHGTCPRAWPGRGSCFDVKRVNWVVDTMAQRKARIAGIFLYFKGQTN